MLVETAPLSACQMCFKAFVCLSRPAVCISLFFSRKLQTQRCAFLAHNLQAVPRALSTPKRVEHHGDTQCKRATDARVSDL